MMFLLEYNVCLFKHDMLTCIILSSFIALIKHMQHGMCHLNPFPVYYSVAISAT